MDEEFCAVEAGETEHEIKARIIELIGECDWLKLRQDGIIRPTTFINRYTLDEERLLDQ
jgi:hypothetical protein